jgi:Peptidase family M1 domain
LEVIEIVIENFKLEIKVKKISLLIIVICARQTAFSQSSYWQQEVHYTINVALNDKQHSLRGNIAIDYINHSPDTLQFIWFHLWPNAYKNDQTALAKQLASAEDKEKTVTVHERGYIDSLQFKINGQAAVTEPDAENIDIIKLLLPKPLLPGAQLTITTPFFVQLPSYYSRSGHDGQQYFVCQWYPKPAVYDRKGWHAFPYLDEGEFYSEYGNFTVHITVPAEYVIGATGNLLTSGELEKYKTIGTENNRSNKTTLYKTDKPGTTKTLDYYGDQIHDFAWFASKDFIIRYDTLQLSSGKPVNVFSYAQSNGNKQWKNSNSYIKDAVRHYSNWVGEYPYPVVQAVEGPKNQSSGGMEYPMITLITSPGADEEELDGVITHEVGHNWMYGMLGTNERDYPWMDEGMNTFLQFRYEAEKYRANSIFRNSLPKEMKKLPEDEFLSRIYSGLNMLPAKQPINTRSTGFANKDDYGIVVYIKTAIWLYLVEKALGKEVVDKGLHEYFGEWKFKHPYPEDLKAILEKTAGTNIDKLWDLLDKEGNF